MYALGYRWGLMMALRVMQGAEAEYKLHLKTKARETRAKRREARAGEGASSEVA